MKIPGGRKTVVIFLVSLAGVWIVGGIVWAVYWNSADNDDVACVPSESPPTATEPADPVDIGTVEETFTVAFGQSRGVSRDIIRHQTDAAAPEEIPLRSSSLEGPNNAEIPPDAVVAKVTNIGAGNLELRACVDARKIPDFVPGSYSGVVVMTDPRVASMSVPITVTAQTRVLPYLSPLVILLPIAGLIVTWTSVTRKSADAEFKWGALKTLLAAIGATGGVYWAQGVENVSLRFGSDIFALFGALYAAALAATATLGGPLGQVSDDNPDKV